MAYRYNGSSPEPPYDPKAGIALVRMGAFVILLLIGIGWLGA